MRRGGFGGIAGLAQYLLDNEINALIDATHPYASAISAHAFRAASETSTPDDFAAPGTMAGGRR